MFKYGLCHIWWAAPLSLVLSALLAFPLYALTAWCLSTDATSPYVLASIYYFLCWPIFWSRGSSVGIATGYGLDDGGVEVRVPVGSRIFSSPCRPDRLWGPPNLLSIGYWGVKRPGREADTSPPTSAEVKKVWIYTSTPHTPSWRCA
jgi:hypothetical protein